MQEYVSQPLSTNDGTYSVNDGRFWPLDTLNLFSRLLIILLRLHWLYVLQENLVSAILISSSLGCDLPN